MRIAPWIVASVVIGLVFALIMPSNLHDRDFSGFWLGGRLLIEGRDPYDPAVWKPALASIAPVLAAAGPAGGGYGYPLWTAVLTLPFAVLPFDVASRAWIGAQAVVMSSGLVALVAALHGRSMRRDLVVLALSVFASQQWSDLIVVGNVGGFLCGIVSWSLTLLLRGRPGLAGAALALLLLKPQLFLVFVPALFVLFRGSWRRLLVGAAAVGAALVVVSLAVRPGWPAGWFTTIGSVVAELGPRATVWALVPGVPAANVLIAAGVALWVILWWRHAAPPPEIVAAGVLPVSLFLAPHAGVYDGLVLFTSLAICLSIVPPTTRWRRPLAIVLVAGAAVFYPWLVQYQFDHHGHQGLGAVVPLLVLCCVVACDRLGHSTTVGHPARARADVTWWLVSIAVLAAATLLLGINTVAWLVAIATGGVALTLVVTSTFAARTLGASRPDGLDQPSGDPTA